MASGDPLFLIMEEGFGAVLSVQQKVFVADIEIMIRVLDLVGMRMLGGLGVVSGNLPKHRCSSYRLVKLSYL